MGTRERRGLQLDPAGRLGRVSTGWTPLMPRTPETTLIGRNVRVRLE